MLPTNEIDQLPFFFIVGRARSGTTLLQTMLDSHPSVIIPGESCVLMHLKNKYFRREDWNNTTVDQFINDIFTEKKLKLFWKLDAEKLREQLYAIAEADRNFVRFSKIVYLNHASLFDKKSIALIGDKNPIYTLFINDLIELFPEAKFIHLIRDYRANSVSNRTVFSLKSVSVLAHAWKYHNEKTEAAKKQFPGRFQLLRYEDLVNDPAEEMKKICAFLNIPFSETMVNYRDAVRGPLPDAENKRFELTHGNLLKPVNSDKVDSWKKSLTEKEIALIEFISGDYAEMYGYARSVKPVSDFSMRLKSAVGRFRNRVICGVIVNYYAAPFVLKKISGLISRKLYEWFKIKNYFNQTDFID